MEGASMAAQLEQIARELSNVVLMVADVLASWAMEVGHRCGHPHSWLLDCHALYLRGHQRYY